MSTSETGTLPLGAFASAWGPQGVALAGHDDFVPIVLSGMQTMLNKFLSMGMRDRAWLILSFVLLVGAWLLWPILFSLRADGITSMPWAAVWTPLWIVDGIGLLFFLFLVSWGKIKAPPGREEGWRDPYPMSMRVLALGKWLLLLLFQIFLVLRLDGRNSWSWEKVISPMVAWVCLRTVGGLNRLRLQTKRLLEGRIIEAAKILGESAMLLLQLVFITRRLDGEVDWNWWIVFIPTWVIHFGQMVSFCANHVLAMFLVKELEDNESRTEEERRKILEASLVMDNAKFARQVFGGSLITTILAVFLINGADYSTFYVFAPAFVTAGWLVCAVTCLVCCIRGGPREELEGFTEGIEGEGQEQGERPSGV